MDDDTPAGRPTARPRLPDRVRDAIARRHYSRRTEETYVHADRLAAPGADFGFSKSRIFSALRCDPHRRIRRD